MVAEKYWGQNILDNAPFDRNTRWYWASAGKTLAATLVGIAQQEGDLNINLPSSTYLGNGWTSLPPVQEDLITVKDQLTMTTGLDYNVSDLNCTQPSCLQYKSDPGSQWYYHNAPYTLLGNVVSNATGMDYNTYTDQKIEGVIGMDGQWIQSGFNNTYWSTPRDMARFGLLMLNGGVWDDTAVLSDGDYYQQMVTTSQDLNPSYGYLWWLNGKNSIIYPGLPQSFMTNLAPDAPVDLIAAMGKNGQFIDIVPSEGLVVIRMGNTPDDLLVPMTFHNDIWERLQLVLEE